MKFIITKKHTTVAPTRAGAAVRATKNDEYEMSTKRITGMITYLKKAAAIQGALNSAPRLASASTRSGALA